MTYSYVLYCLEIGAKGTSMARTEARFTRQLFKASIGSDDVEGLRTGVARGGRLRSEHLAYAVIMGSHHSVRWLLSKGIRADVFEGGLSDTALGEYLDDLAEGKWNFMGLKLLLSRKGLRDSGNDGDVVKDITPLTLAAVNDHVWCAEALIAGGANVNHVDRAGQSALMTAAHQAGYRTVRCLVEHGANVNLRSDSGLTALMTACMFMSRPQPKIARHIVDFLLRKGADVNASDIDHDTALMLVLRGNVDRCSATTSGTAEMVGLVGRLIGAGADVNAVGLRGRTPLMETCRFQKVGSEMFARMLLKHGADVNAACDSGVTPLMEAAVCNTARLVGLLLRWGAHVNASDHAGKSALELVDIYNNRGMSWRCLASNVKQGRIIARTLIAGGAELRSLDISDSPYLQEAWERQAQLKLQLKHLCRERVRNHMVMLQHRKPVEAVIWKLEATDLRVGLPKELVTYLADAERFAVIMFL